MATGAAIHYLQHCADERPGQGEGSRLTQIHSECLSALNMKRLMNFFVLSIENIESFRKNVLDHYIL